MSGTTKKTGKREIDVDQKIEDTLHHWKKLKPHLEHSKEVTI